MITPNEYFKNTVNTIQKAIEALDGDTFSALLSDCANSVQNGNKIIVSGLGKNVPICEKFVGTLNSFGINASFMHTNSAIHGDLGIIKDNDVVIFLSKSGNTAETLLLLDHVLKRKTVLWCLTFDERGELYKRTVNRLLIHMDTEGDKWDIVPNNSTALNLIVLQGLAMLLSDRLGITLADFKRNHPGGSIGDTLREASAAPRLK